MNDFGSFLLKLVILGVISPLWLPIARAFWEEINLALADEGGVFGRIPTGAQLRRMEEEREWRPDPLVHEPWGTGPGARRRAANIREKEGKSDSGKGSSPRQAAAAPRQTRGF